MRILTVTLLGIAVAGCGDKSGGNGTPDMAVVTTLGPAPALLASCTDTIADIYTLPGGMAAMDDSHRGDVFRCAPSESLTVAHANAQATAMGYPGPALASGFWTYRIAFRSMRASDAAAGPGSEGDMAAVLIVPEKPLAGAPLVVFGHPTVGIAPGCATSHIDLSDPMNLNDYSAAVIPLAGYGYPVIIPDYAGDSYGQPPGYFNAEDEAYAMLDATRAAAKLLPSTVASDKVVFVGHSQGGHAALSAEHYAKTYGLSGKLVGVATYAPYWTSLSSFGAITSPVAMFNTTRDPYAIEFAMFYFYSQGELRDGPGMGLSMFQSAKRDLVKQTLMGTTACYDLDNLKKLGATPYDFFDQTWSTRSGRSAPRTRWAPIAARPMRPNGRRAGSGIARRWIRPARRCDWYAGMDTNISPGLAQCARDRFTADLAVAGATGSISYCFDATAIHTSVPRMNAAHVNQWIAARAGIGSEPPACPSLPTTTCQTPPNDF